MTKRLFWEVDKLKQQILELSAMVEHSVISAVKSVTERDLELADEVIRGDEEIDLREVDIEEECLKLIALHQPVAHDLRYIVAVLKINNDLERIGDLAVNIAQRARDLNNFSVISSASELLELAEGAKAMLRKSLTALLNLDGALAKEVLISDDQVDAIHRGIFRTICAAIKDQPEQAEALVSVLTISRNLERLADHATNIAEEVLYMIEGKIVRHGRATLAVVRN